MRLSLYLISFLRTYGSLRKMTAFIRKDPKVYEDIGTSCTVPNTDVAKVSYYIHSVTIACGVDLIMDDLVDYKNFHTLTQARQDAIFELAYEKYSPKQMSGKTLFTDADRTFTAHKPNAFLKITECTSVLVTSSAIIGGKETEISKVMVFTDQVRQENPFGGFCPGRLLPAAVVFRIDRSPFSIWACTLSPTVARCVLDQADAEEYYPYRTCYGEVERWE